MTWKEFKDEVERQGVKDNNTIDYIDVSTDLQAMNIRVHFRSFSDVKKDEDVIFRVDN